MGFFSLFAAHRYPDARIVALEPLPVNFSQLQRHRDLNPHIRLECLAMAASGTEGSLVLNVNRNDHFTTSASIQTGRWSRRDTVQVNVPSMPLPRLFEFRRIERCDLLKLDCEGAEFDLLYLCPRDTLDRIDRIAMEVHEGTGGDQTPEAMERFLEDVGFSVERKGSGPLSMLWAERASVQ